ncbi:MAG: aminoacyl-tRNA hydrolase [Eubacterium sp.]|nr:aminoacyl-tRNA hydrolase [Eubacterium sp.]
MKIIVGLGNPGLKYAGSRHNMGFSAITALSDKHGIKLNKKELKSITGHGFIEGEKVVLAEPQTYMNLSGEAVRALIDFYKCTAEDLIIIYDDADIDVGRIRIRKQGSAGGHNGIKNIIEHLGTDTFDRIKIGIGKRPDEWEMMDYVLSRPAKEDLPTIRDAVNRAADAVSEIIRSDADSAMNLYN